MKYTRLKNIFFLIVLSIFFNGISAQITGKIIDATDSYSLEYATVALYKQKDSSLVTGVLSNIDGNFSIEGVKNGWYYIEASFVGYTSKTIRDIEVSKKHTLDDYAFKPDLVISSVAELAIEKVLKLK